MSRLWANAAHFRRRLQSGGVDTGHSETPIVPILVGRADRAKQAASVLFARGIVVQPLVPPKVQQERARLRAIVTSEHSLDELTYAADSIIEVAQDLRFSRASGSALARDGN